MTRDELLTRLDEVIGELAPDVADLIAHEGKRTPATGWITDAYLVLVALRLKLESGESHALAVHVEAFARLGKATERRRELN